MRILFSLVIIFISSFAQAREKSDSVCFYFTFEGEVIHFNQTFYSEKIKDSISFNNLKLYISSGELWLKDQLIDTLDKKYHLVDLENPASWSVKYPANKKFDRIKFIIGIDSATNVSGAMGGDLDPTMGMYWAWNSGYINFKLEGKSSVCPTRKNVFQFHLGGYQFPFPTYHAMEMETTGKNAIVIEIAIDEFLDQIDLKDTHEIMSPGAKTFELSNILTKVIHLQSP